MGRHARSKNAMSGGHFAGQGPDPYSRASAGDYHDRLAKKRRRGFALRTLLIALVVLLAGAGVAVAAWLGSIQSKMNNSEVVTSELREALTERDAPNDPYYVLLLGTDGRPGETQYRSDTIILARIDPQQKVATLLSIPRDTMVTWKGSTMKINGVHAYDGAAGMVQIVSDLCHVEISHYAEVNFDGLSGITDALGGVTVDVDMDIKDTEHFDDVTELQKGRPSSIVAAATLPMATTPACATSAPSSNPSSRRSFPRQTPPSSWAWSTPAPTWSSPTCRLPRSRVSPTR